MEEEKRITADYLICLLKTVLNGTKPMEKPDNVSFEKLYLLAKFHCVQCMAYYAVEKLTEKPEAELNHKWRNERDQHIAKSIVQLSERDLIINKLTSAGIDVLPLKGCLLKEMYPQADYREMADLDMLIDAKKAQSAKEVMEKLGYSVEDFDRSNHDNYVKPPYLGVELHREMIHKQYETHNYYSNVWKMAIPDDERPHSFRFSWEDYYVYLVAHFAKHYFTGGSGIRSIMDIHVFFNKHGNELEEQYLKQQFETLGLWDFKRTAELLAECWFGEGEQAENLEEMVDYVITSGAYGTLGRKIENKLKEIQSNATSPRKGKIKYVFSRAFLPYKEMCISFPILKRIPVLLPACYIMRLFLAITKKRKRVNLELKAIINAKK